MPKSIPLGIKELESLAAGLRRLAEELRDDVPAKAMKESAKVGYDMVEANVLASNLDGNTDYDVYSTEPLAMVGARFGMRGSQVAYLEFGTGATGAENPYPRPEVMSGAMYAYSTKKGWGYYKDGDPSVLFLSRGLPAQAPVHKAAQQMRNGVFRGIVAKHVKVAAKDVLNSI